MMINVINDDEVSYEEISNENVEQKIRARRMKRIGNFDHADSQVSKAVKHEHKTTSSPVIVYGGFSGDSPTNESHRSDEASPIFTAPLLPFVNTSEAKRDSLSTSSATRTYTSDACQSKPLPCAGSACVDGDARIDTFVGSQREHYAPATIQVAIQVDSEARGPFYALPTKAQVSCTSLVACVTNSDVVSSSSTGPLPDISESIARSEAFSARSATHLTSRTRDASVSELSYPCRSSAASVASSRYREIDGYRGGFTSSSHTYRGSERDRSRGRTADGGYSTRRGRGSDRYGSHYAVRSPSHLYRDSHHSSYGARDHRRSPERYGRGGYATSRGYESYRSVRSDRYHSRRSLEGMSHRDRIRSRDRSQGTRRSAERQDQFHDLHQSRCYYQRDDREYSATVVTDSASSSNRYIHHSSCTAQTSMTAASGTGTTSASAAQLSLHPGLPARRRWGHTDLPLEWWERAEDCKEAKAAHTRRIDHMCDSREGLVLKTTLWKDSTVLEPNMFPYWTPPGVEHFTLWSIQDLAHEEIVAYVDKWLHRHMPSVRRWQYDDNSGERSIDLFHVHVFIETRPFSFTPREGFEYFPPHTVPIVADSGGAPASGTQQQL